MITSGGGDSGYGTTVLVNSDDDTGTIKSMIERGERGGEERKRREEEGRRGGKGELEAGRGEVE